ncbi:MAG: ABC-F family ATP-binding cassette domain-containing protein, partial [Oligoflexales bacterium]|nr:ABC-F family ATP-binding cassette domain-containing protein [Oligoflexales bacterium]
MGIFEGDRVGIVGPNGSGKSTLLKILSGKEDVDSGIISRKKNLKIAFVSQVSEFKETTVHDTLKKSAKEGGLSEDEADSQADVLAGKAGLDQPFKDVSTLSGGWKKRLSILSAIIQNPDLMLLDEPTNHLDLEGLIWLEEILSQASFAWVLVTHDRYFLNRTARKIGEIHRIYPDGIQVFNGNYDRFMEKRSEFMNAQEKQLTSLTTKVRREDEWLSRGAQARTTKARHRIERAENL